MPSYPKTVLTFNESCILVLTMMFIQTNKYTHTFHSETFGSRTFVLLDSGLRGEWQPVCVTDCPLCTGAEVGTQPHPSTLCMLSHHLH